MKHEAIALTVCLLATGLATSVPAQTVKGDYVQNAICVDGTGDLCGALPTNLPGLSVTFGYNPSSDAGQTGDAVSQTNFDYFAWQMFVALNWPQGTGGQPSTTATIASDATAPRVWEAYKTVGEVYPGNDDPSVCAENVGRLQLNEISKLATDSFTEPFTPYPLIDRNGNYVVYDIRINDAEANYISENNLDTQQGQKAFGQPWNLPAGHDGMPGAIELKTAWRIFTDPGEAIGFFTLPGAVEVPKENSATGDAQCLNVTLGLVGMHIMQKIQDPSDFSPFWVWATFEHVLNAPDAVGAGPSAANSKSKATPDEGTNAVPVGSCPAPETDDGKDWSFFQAACSAVGQSCAPNAPPLDPSGGNHLWQAQQPFAMHYLTNGKFGTQATRCWAIYDSAQHINSLFQAKLAGTAWANYQLVGAQWAQAASEGAPSIKPFAAPMYLTNTTLETYLQINPIGLPENTDTLGGSPGSCIACHDFATDHGGNKSDFSFLAFDAQESPN
jgi:hypothetical protein